MTIVWILLLLWGVLLVLFSGGARWFQNAIYSEPAAGLSWRGPLAATLLTLLLGLWAYLDYQSPGQYTTLFLFSATEDKEFREIQAVIRRDGKDVTRTYRVRKTPQGSAEYRAVNPPHLPLPRHPEAIIVKEDGQDVRFEPERDAERHFKIQEGQSLKYIDPQGRVMTEDTLGRLSVFQWDRFTANMALNLGHFLLWFLCLWLVVRFQWAHALGLAVVCWIIMTVLVVPALLSTVEQVATQSPGA